MNRDEVYRAIDSERAYQQAKDRPDEHTHLRWEDAIEYYFEKARSPHSRIEMWPVQIRKIAALCVAALEQYGVEQRAGYEQPPAPTMPAPDWAQAPARANFAVVDSDLTRWLWYEVPPTLELAGDMGWWWSPVGWWDEGPEVDLPVGIDWRTTLQERPKGEAIDGSAPTAEG